MGRRGPGRRRGKSLSKLTKDGTVGFYLAGPGLAVAALILLPGMAVAALGIRTSIPLPEHILALPVAVCWVIAFICLLGFAAGALLPWLYRRAWPVALAAPVLLGLATLVASQHWYQSPVFWLAAYAGIAVTVRKRAERGSDERTGQ